MSTTQRSPKRTALKTSNSASRLSLKHAQQGNPKALESLMRQQLQRRPEGRGVRVRVDRRNATLLIHLMGASAPRRAEMLAWAKQFFARLPIAGVNGAQIMGHRGSIKEPVWTERVPVRSRTNGWRLTPALAGTVFGGFVLLTLFWGVASMMRGSGNVETAGLNEESTGEAIAESAGATVTQVSATTPTETVDDGPDYKVIREEIFDGKRIQIDTNDADLTRDECIAIASKFLEEAGVDGKVVVQKPNPKPPWSGKRAPFCANNNDGAGTFFNDEYF